MEFFSRYDIAVFYVRTYCLPGMIVHVYKKFIIRDGLCLKFNIMIISDKGKRGKCIRCKGGIYMRTVDHRILAGSLIYIAGIIDGNGTVC